MRTVVRLVIALAAIMGVMALPAIHASADVSTCANVNPKRCVVVQQSTKGSLRALGSLQDLEGNGSVAVAVYLQRWDGAKWITVKKSPRIEANGYALTATPWHTCAPAVYRAQLNWNYRRGWLTGTSYTPTWKVGCP